ncbi:hypothetical protein Acsp01_81100 [Actinoplanes sp. NBRC 101535]|nr:hypothetical protein Acsp01_81100 [Actinoplanes sp. NBRC 101535]
MPLAGCSATGDTSPSAGGTAPAIEQPFAIFHGDSLGVVDYAQLKVQNQCLADNGYPQNLRVMSAGPRNPFPQLVVTASTFGPASEDEARAHGFGQDEPAVPPSVVSFDANYDRASDRCFTEAWKRLSDTAEKVYYSYFDLGNALSMPFHLTVNERVGRANWDTLLSCLSADGYTTTKKDDFYRYPDPGLFGVPLGLTAGAEEEWEPKGVAGTVEVGPATPARRYQPTERETDFALSWFRCRRDTGIAEKQTTAVVDVQKELVAKNEDRLTALNPQVEELAKQAAALIGGQ